jgi:hypothetical protein
MPFQPINFAGIEPQGIPQGNQIMPGLIASLTNAYKLSQMPQQFQQQGEAQRLTNAYAQMRNQQEPQRFQGEQEAQGLQNALRQAQAKKLQQESEAPLGGAVVPGALGQALWLHKIKQEYGEKSPQFQDAKRAFDAELEQKQYLNQYRNALTENAGKRFSTNLGKQEQEIKEIEEGHVPGTGGKQELNPTDQQAMLDRYKLNRQKGISDTQTRQRALFASNVDKTLAEINPEDLTQYGGIKGQAKLKTDELAAGLGSPSEGYQKYQKALTLSTLLAKQVRQFYGDSITPGVQEKLAMLTSPASWKNDPVTALGNFKTFKNILQKETETYRGGLKNTKEYEGEKESGPKRLKFNPGTGAFE